MTGMQQQRKTTFISVCFCLLIFSTEKFKCVCVLPKCWLICVKEKRRRRRSTQPSDKLSKFCWFIRRSFGCFETCAWYCKGIWLSKFADLSISKSEFLLLLLLLFLVMNMIHNHFSFVISPGFLYHIQTQIVAHG